MKKLNPKQEMFCRLYTTNKEFFGNGTQAYIEAYKPDRTKRNWYQTARSVSSEILTNPNICRRISELLEASGLNDLFVNKQILFLVTQFADFNVKIRAIQEYNKIKRRITENVDPKVRRLISKRPDIKDRENKAT